ncbi:MAG TPA: hypothetical protein VG733_01350, partial [Chthoniobacteraceae bacterium]|nr:hypothetical protein [Chthoniobacteraceae bacterium]
LASNESSDTESLKEYIPKDETFDTWTKLASVHVFKQVNDPLAAAQALDKELKKKYPDAHSRIIQNPDTGEVIIDFLILAPDHAFAEWNVMKYDKAKDGGTVVYQYALRAYGEKITDFLKGLKDERIRLVDLMAKDGLAVSR